MILLKNREDLVYNFMSGDVIGYDEFISKEKDTIYCDIEGDWDDPTGRNITLYDKDEILHIEHTDYIYIVETINNLFEKGVDKDWE